MINEECTKRTLEEDLAILLERSKEYPSLSIEEILEILCGKGRSLILIFLSIPFCLPIQIPGMSTPFGIMIAIIGLRIAFGKHPWLPKRILLKQISASTIEKITLKSIAMMKKIRRWIHPRMLWLCKHWGMQVVNGVLIFILGILLALPLPIPFTNIAVGWSILLVSLGLLEDDGVFVLIGYLASLFTLILFGVIIFSIKSIF